MTPTGKMVAGRIFDSALSPVPGLIISNPPFRTAYAVGQYLSPFGLRTERLIKQHDLVVAARDSLEYPVGCLGSLRPYVRLPCPAGHYLLGFGSASSPKGERYKPTA
jgi:hypothetical protein